MPKIIDEISQVRFLKNIVIGLDKANKKEFKIAKSFSRLLQRHEILWNDGPNLKKLNKQLAEQNLAPQEMGKAEMFGIVWIYSLLVMKLHYMIVIS